MRQQIDPIAQAMQILQLVAQRRGQQANIDQGQQRLDLMQQQIDQQGQQFDAGLGWDREQAAMRQQQQQQMFDAQQQQHLFDAANNQALAQRNYGLEEQKLLQQVQQHKQMMELQRLQALGMIEPTLQQQMMMQHPGTMDAEYAQKIHDAVTAEILKAIQVPMPARPQVSPIEQQLFTR